MAPREYVGLRLALSFLCAGSSALLLALAHARADLWPLSLIAFVPFLWRATRATLLDALVLGTLLGCALCFVFVPNGLHEPWLPRLLDLGIVVGLFALYGVLSNRIVVHVGVHAVLLALLWIPVERLAGSRIYEGGVLTFSQVDSSVLMRGGALLGALMISFTIVLVNSIVLILTEVVVGILHRGSLLDHARRPCTLVVDRPGGAPRRRAALLPHPRGPPADASSMWFLVSE